MNVVCLREAESIDHLLVSYPFACSLWFSINGWFNCSWVLLNSLGSSMQTWSGGRLCQGEGLSGECLSLESFG